jgi:hypothetical protein
MEERGKPKPLPLAIIICDSVYRDGVTGKATLLGLFSRIHAKTFPVIHPQLFVFVSLTDGRGQMEAELRLVERETNEQVMSLRGPIAFPTPLDVVEMVFDVRNLKFDAPGNFVFEFRCGGEILGQRRFEVTTSPAGTEAL